MEGLRLHLGLRMRLEQADEDGLGVGEALPGVQAPRLAVEGERGLREVGVGLQHAVVRLDGEVVLLACHVAVGEVEQGVGLARLDGDGDGDGQGQERGSRLRCHGPSFRVCGLGPQPL